MTEQLAAAKYADASQSVQARGSPKPTACAGVDD